MNGLRQWVAKTVGKPEPELGDELDAAPRSVGVDELGWLGPMARAQLRSWGKGKIAPGNPPSWVGSEATWERAKKAVEKKWGDYDEPWAVVAHVYKNMGGAVK